MDHGVRERQHAAVAVVYHEPFLRAKQLVGNDEGPDRLVVHPSAGVTYHMRISLRETGELGRVKPRVHARDDGEMPPGWNRQFSFLPKILLVGGVCRQNFI